MHMKKYYIILGLTFWCSLSVVYGGQLSEGKWYKFKVVQSGVYQLTYDDISGLGFETPADIRIFGQGGKQLSYWVNDPRPEGLLEIPIYMNKGTDGIFNKGDYILFYLQGPLTWSSNQKFIHKNHDFTTTIQYFLTTSIAGNITIPVIDNLSEPTTAIAEKGDWYMVHEKNEYNVIKSGRQWFGERFDISDYAQQVTIPNVDLSEKVSITAQIVGRSAKSTTTSLWINGESVKSASIGSIAISNTEASYGRIVSLQYDLTPSSESFNLGLSYKETSLSDRAYLDYIRITARVNLIYKNEQAYYFRDLNSVGTGNVTLFKINSLPSSAMIWNISQIDNVEQVKGRMNGNVYEFVDNTSEIKEYVAVIPGNNYPKPIIDSKQLNVGFIANQNLKGLPVQDLLIITHPAFIEPAEALAELHREKDHLTVAVVTTDAVYNEFSSGTRDASAIRDFIRNNYLKGTPEEGHLRYVLLFGDGSYNNHMDVSGNTNYVPTYQSPQSLEPIYSFVSDDFYALLDEYEGEMSGDLDVGVGRLPVKSDGGQELEAWGVVNKIIQYYDASTMGDWRLRLCFLADDAEANWEKAFSRDSDYILRKIDASTPYFSMDKLFLDAFDQVTTSSGASYPSAQKAMHEAIEKGVLVFNYMGHGNENGATEEKVLQLADMEALKNGPLYPLFVTATCKLGPYDRVDMVNAETINSILTTSEAALLNPEGGAIALFTTTRVVFQSNNFDLTDNLYSYLFTRDEDGELLRLGDVFRIAKNVTNDDNMHNFSLLGDPALRLAVPELLVVVDSVNGFAVNENIDTVGAFEEVTIKGHVEDGAGSQLSNFNGTATIMIYDKEITVVTDYNDYNKDDSLRFKIQKNVIYKGQASVINGWFETKFRVPKDISYSYGQGKITCYISDGVIDGAGSTEQMVIGGTSSQVLSDDIGPQINLYLNNADFVQGGISGPDPILYAEVFDESGINTTGAGIGHDIIAYIDDEQNDVFVLNDYYTGALDDYRGGIIKYPLDELDPGEHTLTLKVWDINNNSSTASIVFVVEPGNELVTNNLTNFPNPFSDFTTIQYEHNSPGVHNVQFSVFDLSGRIIADYSFTNIESGFVSQPIIWDGTTNTGGKVQAGLYPYRLIINTQDGKRSIIHQKLIIINR